MSILLKHNYCINSIFLFFLEIGINLIGKIESTADNCDYVDKFQKLIMHR